MLTGRINSFQSFGTADGPGVRAVVFMQGCPLRCVCCHNPETWDFDGGEEMSTDTLFDKIMRCKSYFGKDGGVTVSGGEPLMQSEFLTELFIKLHAAGIHTALDTSGCILTDPVKELLCHTDLILLDYKYTNADDYKKYTLSEKSAVDSFLCHVNEKSIPVILRQVIIPGLNDSEESVKLLAATAKKHDCVFETELLPFKKLCLEKYEALNIHFPLCDTPEAAKETIKQLSDCLHSEH